MSDSGKRISSLAADLIVSGWMSNNEEELERHKKRAEKKLLDFACDEINRHMNRQSAFSERPYDDDTKVERYVSTHEKLTPYEREILTILQEECAELIVYISKAIRFGLGDGYPGDTETNYEAIGREIGDIDALVHLAMQNDLYCNGARTNAAKNKVERLKKYMQNLPDAFRD